MQPLGKRFFTDLRLVQIQSYDQPVVMEYLNKLKSSIEIANALKYTNVKSNAASLGTSGTVEEDVYIPPISEESQEIMDTINEINVEDILSGVYGEDSQNDIIDDGYIPGNNYGDNPGIDEVQKGGIIKRKKR